MFLDHLFILTPSFITHLDKPWPSYKLPRSLQGLFLKVKLKWVDKKERTSAKISPKKQTSNVMKHPMWQEKCVRLLNSALHLLSLKMLSLSVNALFLWGRLMSMAVVYRYGNEPRDRFFLIINLDILVYNFCYYFV